jgi:hypothetical protein
LTHSIVRSLIGQGARFIATRGTANSDVALEGFKVDLDVDVEKCCSLRRNPSEMDFEDKCQSFVSRHCISLS